MLMSVLQESLIFLTHELVSWTLLSPQYSKRNQMVTSGF